MHKVIEQFEEWSYAVHGRQNESVWVVKREMNAHGKDNQSHGNDADVVLVINAAIQNVGQ